MKNSVRLCAHASRFSRRRPPTLARFWRAGALALAAAVGIVGLAGPALSAPAHAAEYDVTSGADEGPGTLREAVESIDPSDPDPVVTIAGGLEILLEDGIQVPEKLTVRGVAGNLPVITFDAVEVGSPGTLFRSDAARIDFLGENFAVRGVPDDGESDYELWDDIVNAHAATEAVVTLRGVEVVGAHGGIEVSNAPHAQLLIEDSAFTGIGNFRDGEDSFLSLSDDFAGSVAVKNSSFDRLWHHLVWAKLAEGTVSIEGSRFTGPGLSSMESEAGVLALYFQGGADPEQVPVVIRDSVFSGVGADQAGVMYLETDGAAVGANVAAEISGSTFEGTLVEEDAANAIVMELEDANTAVTIRNSTFALPPTSAHTQDREAAVRQGSSNTARLVLDHVTSVGVGIMADEAPVVTIQDSAFQTTPTGIVFGTHDAEALSEGEELAGMDLSQVEIERTVVSAPGPRFPQLPATPEAEFLLGELADNGGPTPTMLPGPGSALLGAAGGELTVDQRGVARPSGAKPDAGAVEVQIGTLALAEDVTVPEGQPLEFVVTRVGGEAGYPASVAFATADGTAVAPTNYVAAAGTLEWAAGDLEPKRFTVESVRDGVVTDPLEFTVGLSAPSGGTVIPADAETRTGTLTNVDEEDEVVPPTPDPDPTPESKPDPEPSKPPAPGGGLAQTGGASLGGLWILGALGAGVGALALMRGLRRRANSE